MPTASEFPTLDAQNFREGLCTNLLVLNNTRNTILIPRLQLRFGGRVPLPVGIELGVGAEGPGASWWLHSPLALGSDSQGSFHISLSSSNSAQGISKELMWPFSSVHGRKLLQGQMNILDTRMQMA